MKKLLFSFLLFLFAIPQLLIAQDGWIKNFQGPGSEYSGNLITTSDGNYLFSVAANEGFGNGLDTGQYLVKLDISGNVLWMYNVIPGMTGIGSSSPVIQTNDNGFLVLTTEVGTNGNNQPYFIKLTENGTEEWATFTSWGNGPTSSNYLQSFVQSSDGGYLVCATVSSSSPDNGYIKKLDADLNEVWSFNETVIPTTTSGWLDIKEIPGGEILATGYNGRILKLDPEGNLIWEKVVPNVVTYFRDFHSLPDGSIMLFTNNSTALPPNNLPHHQIKLDSNGDLIWDKEILTVHTGSTFYTHIQVSDGFIGSGTGRNDIPNNIDGFSTYLIKTDFDGNIVWENEVNQEISPWIERSQSIVLATDNGIIGLGSAGNTRTIVFKTDSLGNIYSNKIIGKVVRDNQPNCVVDSAETVMTGWIVTAENSNQTYYASTDSIGNYLLSVDNGDYVLSINPPSIIWEACENNIDISVGDNATIENDFPMEALIDCPLLVVSGSLSAARPCFDNNRYHVNYCNEGTVTANNAYIEIQVENELSYVSSSSNLSLQNGNIYTFNLGDISSGECGNFYVDFLLDCDAVLGASTCILSHIYPDSFCLTNQNWSGAFVEVDVVCDNDSVNFYIENTGPGDMLSSKEYKVVEDAIIVLFNSFQLNSGQVDSFSLPANAATFALIAEQVENAPGDPFPTSWVEGCGANGGSFSTGYINQFSLGDNIPYLDEDCRVISSSYDPNDKQGYPLGYGDEHFIQPNTDLEYKIQFQNTGTDTAFTVVLRDTLSELLNIPSIRVGAASHLYEWKIVGGNVLEFTFNSIMLPDSNVNEAASNGFVEFKISQKTGLPLGTVINNKAAIYFDYNEAIITNETFHTLDNNFITKYSQNLISEENSILVRPNPMQDIAIFELKKEIKNGNFELHDVTGKKVFQQKFTGQQFEIQRNGVNAGIYFFNITENNRVINSGKIVIK